jgi:hypothetical protein
MAKHDYTCQGYGCTRRATIAAENGRSYCWQHDPVRTQAIRLWEQERDKIRFAMSRQFSEARAIHNDLAYLAVHIADGDESIESLRERVRKMRNHEAEGNRIRAKLAEFEDAKPKEWPAGQSLAAKKEES